MELTTKLPVDHIENYYNAAGGCNAQNLLPLPVLAQHVIDISTIHANRIGVGYDRLIARGMAWVLSRLSIEMCGGWPSVNEAYQLRTWVESYNRHFSERNIEITGEGGRLYGFARAIWMPIRVADRKGGSLEGIDELREVMNDRPCPIDKAPKLSAVAREGAEVACYRFRYTDCDNNRHVNTTRYIELLLNQHALEFYDHNLLERFDIAFHHESYFGQEAEVITRDEGNGLYNAEIIGPDGVTTRARMRFRKWNFQPDGI